MDRALYNTLYNYTQLTFTGPLGPHKAVFTEDILQSTHGKLPEVSLTNENSLLKNEFHRERERDESKTFFCSRCRHVRGP